MKETDENDLRDYLQGKDGVSGSYASFSQEKPSAELDDKILQAARSALEDQGRTKKRIPYQAYSIAASICVSVLLISLYLNSGSQLSRDLFEQSQIQIMDNPDVEFLSADEVQIFIPEAAELEANALESLNTQVESVRRVETQAASQEAIIVRQEAAEDVLATRFSEDDLAVTDTLASELSSATVEPLAAQAGYRQNADTWLREIQRLQATEPAQAAEEIRLFTESYPDVNIEAALTDLNEAID